MSCSRLGIFEHTNLSFMFNRHPFLTCLLLPSTSSPFHSSCYQCVSILLAYSILLLSILILFLLYRQSFHSSLPLSPFIAPLFFRLIINPPLLLFLLSLLLHSCFPCSISSSFLLPILQPDPPSLSSCLPSIFIIWGIREFACGKSSHTFYTIHAHFVVVCVCVCMSA